MAYCGARTTKGGYCRNPAGSCPNHGLGASTQWRSPSRLTSVPAREPLTTVSYGSESSSWPAVGGNIVGAGSLLLIVALLLHALTLGTMAQLAIAAGAVLLPFALASWFWVFCGAWNTSKPGRCHRRRRGFLVRCHHHGGATLYDALGLIWALIGVGAVLLFLVPVVRGIVQA